MSSPNVVRSQCTFWCSVLSDLNDGPVLNELLSAVSMHLLVLSAFRLTGGNKEQTDALLSQCTFWCSVLSDFVSDATFVWRASGLNAPSGAQCFPTSTIFRVSVMAYIWSQCTFWCSVLSDVV